MYCKNCGTKNKDDARFCANCGQKLVEDEPVKEQPQQDHKDVTKKPKSATNPGNKNWIMIAVCVVVIAAAGIFGYQYSKSKNKKEAQATTNEKTTAKTTASTAEDNTGEDVADAKEETKEAADNSTDNSSVVPYTNNDKKDLEACKDSDNYAYFTSKNRSFTFLYPKYLFNESYEEDGGNQYILEHTTGDGEDDCDYRVTITKTDTLYENDPVTSVQTQADKFKSKMKKLTYQYPETRAPKIYDGDKATMIVKGYLDSKKTKYQYLMATSDNESMYTLVIEYRDSNYKNEHKPEDYVADCMYRGCSFSNTTKAVRPFTEFENEDKN